jgi:hypothetical protein
VKTLRRERLWHWNILASHYLGIQQRHGNAGRCFRRSGIIPLRLAPARDTASNIAMAAIFMREI